MGECERYRRASVEKIIAQGGGTLELRDTRSLVQAVKQRQTMKILVHITHGPEAPTRAVLGFHVARAALESGHTVTVFLAGDAVQLARPATVDRLVGLGTGELRGMVDALMAGGASFWLSGGSSQDRGLTTDDLGALSVQFGSPADLVRLAVAGLITLNDVLEEITGDLT